MTPIDTLYTIAKDGKTRGNKAISIDFVLSMIEEYRTFPVKASVRPVDNPYFVARQ